MSAGFYRKGPTRLRRLRIDEVSSVDSGAGYGVRVLLTKRHERKDHTMNTQQITDGGALAFANRVWKMADRGELSQFALGEAMQEIAKYFFGGDMGKMLDSQIGKIFLQPRTARTNAFEEAELQKREGYDKASPKRRRRGARVTSGNSAAADGDGLDREDGSTGGMERDDFDGSVNPMTAANLNDSAESDGPYARATKTATAVKHHMNMGDSYDVAVTKVYRAQCGR
jgi:hypothetical protein